MKIFIFCLAFIAISCTNNQKTKTDYNFIKGLNAYEKDNKVEALKDYNLAYSKGMRETYLLREMAYIYTEFGDLEKAKNLYMEILDKEAENEEVLYNLLKIFYEKKDIENIEKYSKNILNKNSILYIKTQFNLAYLRNNYILARKILENSILERKINLFKGKYDRIFLERIKKIYKDRKNKNLLEILEIAYNSYCNDTEFIKYYSLVLVDNKKYQKAEDVLMKKIINSSNTETLLKDLANIYKLTEQKEKLKNILKILEKTNIEKIKN